MNSNSCFFFKSQLCLKLLIIDGLMEGNHGRVAQSNKTKVAVNYFFDLFLKYRILEKAMRMLILIDLYEIIHHYMTVTITTETTTWKINNLN